MRKQRPELSNPSLFLLLVTLALTIQVGCGGTEETQVIGGDTTAQEIEARMEAREASQEAQEET